MVLSFSSRDYDDESNVYCNANWSSPVVASYNEGPPISAQPAGLCADLALLLGNLIFIAQLYFVYCDYNSTDIETTILTLRQKLNRHFLLL